MRRSNARRNLALPLLAILACGAGALQAQDGVCENAITLQDRACPAGTSCTDLGGARALVASEGDDGFENIANLCVSSAKVNWAATVAPTVTNDVDEGYSVGSRWVDVTADKEYICLDATGGAAVWTETTAGGAGAVDGSGAAAQVTLWQDSDTVEGDPGLTYDAAGDDLTVGDGIKAKSLELEHTDPVLTLDDTTAGHADWTLETIESGAPTQESFQIRSGGSQVFRLDDDSGNLTTTSLSGAGEFTMVSGPGTTENNLTFSRSSDLFPQWKISTQGTQFIIESSLFFGSNFEIQDAAGPNSLVLADASSSSVAVGIGTDSPAEELEVAGTVLTDLNSTATSAGTERGMWSDVDDTGVVTTGTDTTLGLDLDVTRTGATGGTINNTGIDLDLVGDAGGTSTNVGLDVNVSGADTNYAAILQGGKVGIGTSAPNGLLDLESSSSDTRAFISNSATDGDTAIVFDNIGSRAWMFGQDDGDSDKMKLAPSVSADWAGAVLGITVTGELGIGTVSPSTDLHVVGGARVTGLVSCDTIDTDANGVLSCGADAGGGSGDAIEVEDGDDAGTFTAVDTTARFEDQGDINFAVADGGAGGPDSITATVRANSVALTTDTTGNYAAGDAEAGAALTGDSATAFFSAGAIEHERGGLEADVSAYTGLLAISGGATSEVDAKSELESQIADVADFAQADGDTYSGTHDLSGATVTLPTSTVAAAVPTINFDDTDDTGSVDGAIVVTCPTPDDCDMLFGVDSGSDAELTMLQIDTNSPGQSAVKIGSGSNLIVVDENGTMSTQGIASISAGTYGADSIASADIDTIVQSMYWPAGSMSADGTECSDPSEKQINSGPVSYIISCPMAGSETDGFVYGQAVLPDSFVKASDATFEMSAYMTTDSGVGTWHGVVQIQCQSHGDIIDSTWGTGVGLDLSVVSADVVNDVIQDTSGAVDTDTTGADCEPGDVLWWRWKSCDTDATPSTGCTSSGGFENDMSIFGMKMEFTSDVGD